MILKKVKKGVPLLILLLVITIGVNFFDYIKIAVYPAIKNIEKSRLLSTTKGYEKLETDKFTIKYPKGDKEIATMTANIAEGHHDEVASMFNYTSDKKHTIIVYNDADTLLRSVRLKKSKPPLGVYYGGVIHVLSPELWISDKGNMEEIYEENGPIVHEFAHLVVDDITKGNYPTWLTEGIALYAEYITTGYEWGKGINYKEDVTLEDLNDNFNVVDQGLAYRKSFEIVRNIYEAWGFDKVNQLLGKLGEGNNISNSVEASLKINLKDIE